VAINLILFFVMMFVFIAAMLLAGEAASKGDKAHTLIFGLMSLTGVLMATKILYDMAVYYGII